MQRPRQHRDRVIDTGDQQQDALHREGHLLALLRRKQWKDRREDAKAQQRQSRSRENRQRRPVVGVREIKVEQENERQPDERRPRDPIDQRRRAHPQQVGQPPDRRHERVLDRPFPPLPGDGKRDLEENHRQIGPQERPHQQVQLGLLKVAMARLEAER